MLDQQSGRRVCPKGQVGQREEDLIVGSSAYAAPRLEPVEGFTQPLVAGSHGGIHPEPRMSNPEGGKAARILIIVLFVLGGLGILISLPVLGLAALGSLGALADTGPAENQRMALQLLSWGLPPFIGGVAFSVFGFVVFARNRNRADSK